MKRSIFMMAAVALLAMACTKEQQAYVNPSEGLNEIRVTIPDTKAVIAEETGAFAWQDGDKIAIFFASAVDEENEPTAGKKIEFTYNGLYEDGSAKFVTASELPAEYVSAEAVYPASSMSEAGKNSLVREYVYDADSVPVYLVGNVVTNPDGTLASNLEYNASVMKFTLHDIPAYAAGFCLYSKRPDTLNEDGTVKTGTAVTIKTSFPYKTGYTADPKDNSNDIVLYSAIAHSSVPKYVYLVDGDGAEIEGSRKNFTGDATVGHDQFIVMPRIDFKKAELRKDYVVVKGVKWAKGNLQYKDGAGQDGFQTGWRIAPDQWHNFKYVDASADVPTRYDYTNANGEFEHFNLGGLGCYAKDNTANMTPAAPMEISGKVYSKIDGSVELSGDDRFGYNPDKASYWGDIAFWASMGKYRMPTNAEMKNLHNVSDKLLGWYVTPDGKKVWGTLFRTPNPKRSTNSKPEMQFTDADLESGLFLPNAGRRANNGSGSVIAVTTQGTYRTGSYISSKTVSGVLRYYASYLHADFKASNGVVTNSSVKLYDGTLGTMGDAYDSTAGFLLRPVIAE